MTLRGSLFKPIVLLSLTLLTGMLASCSSSNSNTESLRIYELYVDKGRFTAVDDDTTATVFQLTLGNDVPITPSDEILYFTNRGAQEGGNDTVDNVMNNIWPRVYGSVAPNAIIKATTANQEAILLFCILDKPVYNKTTGQISFTITYLDGQRPVSNLAVTDVKMIITNNVAQMQTQVWSHLLEGDVGTFEPTPTDGTYTFRIQQTIGNAAFGYVCAPHRKSSTIAVKEYIQSWQDRFGAIPPNATIAYDATNDQIGGVQIVTLSNPVYDDATGSISFTAKLLHSAFLPIGKSGLQVNSPSIFIDGGDEGFPTYANNVFSIQYRNSSPKAITVWLSGDQPPCSKAEAAAKNCDAGNTNSEYSDNWKKMYADKVFERSGTRFYIVSKTNGKYGVPVEVPVSNHIDLQAGQTLRIVPPITNDIPEWYYTRSGSAATAGVVAWVTKTGISMPAPEPVTVFEYNLASANKEIWFDLSAVNGVNANATMTYEGTGCGSDVKCKTGVTLPKVLKNNIDAYDAKNTAGCPYIMKFASQTSCPNPKFYPEELDKSLKPDWVVESNKFTKDDVASNYADIWTTAGSPSGIDMARAASGDADKKKAYHIWWSTNPVPQGWLNYLQKNAKGNADAYGWAYDEKRWKTGDTFNINGNPPDNKYVNPLVHGPNLKDTYLNIDIPKVMQ